MIPEEENFPRGGRKSNLLLKRAKPNDYLFSENQPKAKRPRRNKNLHKEKVTEKSFQSLLTIHGTLTYKKIQEGMVILGCIRNIKNLTLDVELPGLTFGYVTISDISDPLTQYLNKKLEDNDEETDAVLKAMFKIGQFVVVKVIGIENNEKGVQVKCSVNPREINYEKRHESFKKGMLVWASVQAVLDHGYEINIGVKNCRVFLPAKNVEEGQILSVGEPLWCTIHKSEITTAASTLRVSIKKQHIKMAQIEEITSLHDLIPGMQVEMVIEKNTSNGIQGKFANNYFGYIDQIQLTNPFKKLDDYVGKLLTASILYVEPITKITHLTLHSLDNVPVPYHSIGDVISAEVMLEVHNGIYLKVSSNEKCFVTNKRLINSISKNVGDNIVKTIHTKFPVGSTHKCRILDYSRMSRAYICTVEQAIIKEKLFTVKDINVGQLLSVTVESIKPEGLVVTSGHVRGFVPNLHISDVQFSENIKKKFEEGSKARARVLNINNDNIIFTLKSSLVKSDNCLTEINQAKKGDRYPGVILQTKPAGALVSFYNNVKGWIGKDYFGGEIDHQKIDPTQYFYKGQVVHPRVFDVKEDKVILTLKQPAEFKAYISLRVGQIVNGIINKIHKDKIDVKSAKGKILGTVPVNHLSCSWSLCSVLLNTYRIGEEITGLRCIDNKSQPNILSKREALARNRRKKFRLKRFKKLKIGTLIRCSYISKCKSGIYVLPLILDYIEKVFIENKDIISKGDSLPKFKYQQSLVAKIVEINHESNKLQFTIKLDEVFDKRIESTLGLFSQHLADVRQLRSFGKENGWKLCQYQPGERVLCKIEQLGDEGGCSVSLPNGVVGLVPPHLCPENVKPGQTMQGVFLSQDFMDNYAEICLRRDVSQRINKTQNGVVEQSVLHSCFAEKVIVKNDSIISVLRQAGGNRQLVYIPLYLHENDTLSCRNYYNESKFKICICGKVGNFLIGCSKKLFLSLDKPKQKARTLNKLVKGIKQNSNLIGDNLSKENNENVQACEIKDEDSQPEEDNSQYESKITNGNEVYTMPQDILEISIGGNNIDEDYRNDSVPDNELKQMQANVEKIKPVKKNIKFGNSTINNFSPSASITGPLPVLAGVSSFFNLNEKVECESSSDEEEEVQTVRKKKKLTPAERAEVAKQEEERIRKIEQELADLSKIPESAEQFDKLVLANPNSSELWSKYMSFHIAATEIDKARTVAKRALESINMTLIDEKLNIWIALLNLENMFGTKESFDKTFQEAVKYNDSLQIYLRVIQMLAEVNKFNDMEEKIKKVKSKYKQHPSMWLEVAKVYYLINKFKEARNLKDASLKSIQDKKSQMNIIVTFAVMEFRYGEEERGAAIFETILSSDPRKVNIWTTYIDQLVKKDKIEEARRVLERSVCQRLPLKSMKTLFLKFRMFEERHGTPDSVEAVKEKARAYIVKFSDK